MAILRRGLYAFTIGDRRDHRRGLRIVYAASCLSAAWHEPLDLCPRSGQVAERGSVIRRGWEGSDSPSIHGAGGGMSIYNGVRYDPVYSSAPDGFSWRASRARRAEARHLKTHAATACVANGS